MAEVGCNLNAESTKSIIDLVYPVGSYYWSSNATSPSTLFGGTWEQVKDRFVLAAGDSYKVGATGGEATHTLTVSEMPAHSHGIKSYSEEGTSNEWCLRDFRIDTPVSHLNFQWEGRNISTKGGSQPHNNMPPYITAYCWHRVA